MIGDLNFAAGCDWHLVNRGSGGMLINILQRKAPFLPQKTFLAQNVHSVRVRTTGMEALAWAKVEIIFLNPAIGIRTSASDNIAGGRDFEMPFKAALEPLLTEGSQVLTQRAKGLEVWQVDVVGRGIKVPLSPTSHRPFTHLPLTYFHGSLNSDHSNISP